MNGNIYLIISAPYIYIYANQLRHTTSAQIAHTDVSNEAIPESVKIPEQGLQFSVFYTFAQGKV